MSDVRPVRTARSNLQGGKEELRASLLKTYVLRLRAEKGERAVETLLEGAGVDSRSLDLETAWVSVSVARRALRALATVLGGESSDPDRELVADEYRFATASGISGGRAGRVHAEGDLRVRLAPRRPQRVA